MNRSDEDGDWVGIRNAKEYSDFAIFTMQVHQNRYAFQACCQDHYPAPFPIDFTHKPIFYNLGNVLIRFARRRPHPALANLTQEADQLCGNVDFE